MEFYINFPNRRINSQEFRWHTVNELAGTAMHQAIRGKNCCQNGQTIFYRITQCCCFASTNRIWSAKTIARKMCRAFETLSTSNVGSQPSTMEIYNRFAECEFSLSSTTFLCVLFVCVCVVSIGFLWDIWGTHVNISGSFSCVILYASRFRMIINRSTVFTVRMNTRDSVAFSILLFSPSPFSAFGDRMNRGNHDWKSKKKKKNQLNEMRRRCEHEDGDKDVSAFRRMVVDTWHRSSDYGLWQRRRGRPVHGPKYGDLAKPTLTYHMYLSASWNSLEMGHSHGKLLAPFAWIRRSNGRT